MEQKYWQSSMCLGMKMKRKVMQGLTKEKNVFVEYFAEEASL
ncbi:hypothetical protein ACFOSP_07845 [Clostridium punense]|nr:MULTISPECIES: hypothetical protein [Clostridium]